MARRLLVSSCFLLLVGIVAMALGLRPIALAGLQDQNGKAAEAPERDEEYYQLFRMFVDAMDQVERNFVKPVDRRKLMEAAIEGIVSKLDPYSDYISPEQIDQFRNSVESQFGGIGIQVTVEDGNLTVISPLVGTPAYRAGIRAGDQIVEIKGESTEGLSLSDAVRRMKGATGTDVTISVLHPGEDTPETITLQREIIQIDTVLGNRRNETDDTWNFLIDADKKIGYVRLSAFSRDTAGDLRRTLNKLKNENIRALILDLRFNPGGLLSSAIEISDLFLADGRIVSTEGRNVAKRVWDAKKDGKYEDIPLVVLVNRYSASASEILSGCLQDHQRATVIGERTWGKGSVQNIIELDGGNSALKLTTAIYVRPSGKNIHRFPGAEKDDVWGVHPNSGFELELSDSELAALARHQRDADLVLSKRPGAAQKVEPADEAKTKKSADKPAFVDRQLQKAIDFLSQQLVQAK